MEETPPFWWKAIEKDLIQKITTEINIALEKADAIERIVDNMQQSVDNIGKKLDTIQQSMNTLTMNKQSTSNLTRRERWTMELYENCRESALARSQN